MLTLLTLAGALLAAPSEAPPAAPATPIPAPQSKRGKKVTKVISNWLKIYRKGKWDLTVRDLSGVRGGRGRGGRMPQPGGNVRRPKFEDYLIVKHDLLPKDHSGGLDYVIEIDLLCKLARDLDNEDGTRAVLAVAAVGLDTKVRYEPQMAPSVVRQTAEKHLRRIRGKESFAYLLAAAGGKPGGASSFKHAMQAAALRVLGVRRSSEHRAVMIAQLDSNNFMVRAAAANALGRLGETYGIQPLAERMPKEGHPTVMIEIVSAIDRIRSPAEDKSVKLAHMQMAVIEIGRALGRADTWRPDMAIVDFLEKYRYKGSVPLLIAFLERWDQEPQKVRSGRLSNRLRIRAHEVLTSLTGARIAMTEPAKWREFWESNKNTFQIAKEVKRQDPKGTKGGFFNIPIQGKRIVFVIDRSGSMARPMMVTSRKGPTVAGGRGKRNDSLKMTIAKRELWQAVQSLPVDAKFNVIWYNQQFQPWSKKLMQATDRNKASFKSELDRLRPQGATNIYDPMEEALKIKSLVYGQHYDSNVDEVFLLSDGLPNFGKIRQPSEILRVITETNKFSRVRINTVYLEENLGGMGGGRGGGRGGFPGGLPGGRGGPGGGFAGTGADFMKKLAEQNHGKFVRP